MAYGSGADDGGMRETFQMRALRMAAAALGGEPRLRVYLDASSGELFCWMHGRTRVPEDVMRTVIDLLADLESGARRLPPSRESPATLTPLP